MRVLVRDLTERLDHVRNDDRHTMRARNHVSLDADLLATLKSANQLKTRFEGGLGKRAGHDFKVLNFDDPALPVEAAFDGKKFAVRMKLVPRKSHDLAALTTSGCFRGLPRGHPQRGGQE